MRKLFMMSCHEATYLMAKKEEGKLGRADRVKLILHVSMCRFCRLFERQTRQMGAESRQVRSDEQLSPAFRDRLDGLINENLPR